VAVVKAMAPGAVEARRMALEDVEAVAGIEAASFSAPWKPDTFASLLDSRGAELWVLDDPAVGVVGYAVLWCILDQGELANIAVAESHRGRGHGRQLLATVLEVAGSRGVESLYLEVRVSNAAAIGMYRAFGFTDVGFRKKYYDRPVEDALLMVRKA
jgi:ribosomal-protein-alanine N-acetyltransferase